MKHWFLSDTHFYHANIIKYENRPFKNVEEMNDTLIRNINQRVKDDDQVYFLGDFIFYGGWEGGKVKAKEIVKQLNGKWVFVQGNHCKNNSVNTKIIRMILQLGGIKINCVHRPEHASSNYSLNLCGHVHGRYLTKELTKDSLIINCSVEMHKYAPVSFDEIFKIYAEWKKFKRK